MKIPAYITNLLTQLETEGFQAFVVGGCVRDYLLGLVPDDWDICTSARPEEMLKVFSGFTVVPTGIQHGTVTVVTPEGHAEVTTFRTDGAYADSRHPQSVTFVPDVFEDLARRDFTVNAMAYSPKHGFIDPFGGEADLQQRILRCVGIPEQRFEEDALRILRAIRFSAVYDLAIEPKTAQAIFKTKAGLTHIARERIWTELKKTLRAKFPGQLLKRYPDILSVIFHTEYFTQTAKENPTLWEKSMEYLDTLPAQESLRLAGLLYPFRTQPEIYTAMIHSLKPDNKIKNQAAMLLSLLDTPLPASLPEARRMAGKCGIEMLSGWLSMKCGQAVFLEENEQKAFEQKCTCVHKFLKEIHEKQLCCHVSQLAISGKDLLDAGLPAGTQIGALLQQGLDAVIDGLIPNEKKALMNHLFL